MTANFLAVDIGTSHCRAAVVTDAGRMVSHSQAPLKVDIGENEILSAGGSLVGDGLQ